LSPINYFDSLFLSIDFDYGPLNVTNASKHSLIDQLVKLFLLIDQSNASTFVALSGLHFDLTSNLVVTQHLVSLELKCILCINVKLNIFYV